MRRSLIGAVAVAATAALTLGQFGSSSGGGKASSSGNVTLKLVAADYGTGPGQHQPEVLAGHRGRLPQGQPDDQRQGHHHQLERLRQPGPDADPEPAIPGHHRGRLLLDVRAGGPALLGRRGPLATPGTCCRSSPSRARTTASSTACRSRPARAPCSTTRSSSPQAGISSAPADLGRHPGRRGEDQGAWARSASACRSAPRRRRRSRCCGSWATAATTRTRSGNWTINSTPERPDLAVPEAAGQGR